MVKYAYISKDNTEALMHYGVLGMKWGHRKQKPTSNRSDSNNSNKDKKSFNKKKAIAIGAAVVGAGLAAYGGYKLYKKKSSKSQSKAFEANIRSGKEFLERFNSVIENNKKMSMDAKADLSRIYANRMKSSSKIKQFKPKNTYSTNTGLKTHKIDYQQLMIDTNFK